MTPLDPKDIHTLDQVRALTREVGALIAAYRKELAEGGMDDTEAWALAQRLEERLLGPVYDAAERSLQAWYTPEPWEYHRLAVAYSQATGTANLAAVASSLMHLGIATPEMTEVECAAASAPASPWGLEAWRSLCLEGAPPHDP